MVTIAAFGLLKIDKWHLTYHEFVLKKLCYQLCASYLCVNQKI